MTITELRDEIIVDIGGDPDDTALEAKILAFIKNGLRRFPLWARSRLLLTTSYATLDTGEQDLNVPSDFLQERKIYYYDDGKRRDIEKLSFQQFQDNYSSSASGRPTYYRIINDVIEFHASADTGYTIYIEYFKEPDDVALTDTFFGSNAMAEIAKDFAKGYYYSYEEDFRSADRYFQIGKAGLDRLDVQYVTDEIPDYIEE